MAELQAAIEDANRHLKGTDNDSKVSAVQALERELTNTAGQDVDSTAFESVANLLKLSLRNGNSHVCTAGIACSLALFTIIEDHWHVRRENNQPTTQVDVIFKNAIHTLALPPGGLITFLGDAKDSVRAAARTALLRAAVLSAISGPDSRLQPDQQPLTILDKLIKEQGFGSKNAKTREQSILYITELRASCPTLPLRAWVPVLVNALEDSDPIVRDVARESVITIFTAPTVGPAAKADLKKELVKNGVRKTTSDTILRRTIGSGLPSSSSSLAGSPPGQYGSLAVDTNSGGRRTPSLSGRPTPRPPSIASMSRSPSSGSLPRPSTGPSAGSFKPSRGDRLLKEPKNKTHEELLADLEAVAAANAPPPSTGEVNVVKVVYIASVRDLEQEFEAMQPFFAGKETEFNWQDREKAIFRLRGMLKGNVQQTHRSAFVACLKTIVDGILKAVNSLRTTLAAVACQLVGELASDIKDGLLPLFEPFFGGLLKLASLTKKPIAQAAQDSVTIMLRECPYQNKSLTMLAAMLDQKNVAARIYTAQHLKTLIEAQGKKHKETIESSQNAGLPLLSMMLKKELADANASVRETARATFWLIHNIWPDVGQTILESVDSSTRKGIEKADPRGSRPEATQLRNSSVASAIKPTTGRPSMRELISSRRAAQAAGSSSAPLSSLSASVPASATGHAFKEAAASGNSTPSKQNSALDAPSSPSQLTERQHPRDNATTPTKRPTSMYGTLSSSHIPSPPSNSQHSPRSRAFPSELGQRRSISHTYGSQAGKSNSGSFLEGSRTPTQTVASASNRPMAAEMSRDSSRSSSPPLRLPTIDNEYSDIEASTFDALPDGLESTDDESVNLMSYDATVLRHTGNDTSALDFNERSRLLDGLMDTTFQLPDNSEVEEAVKGLADQAEETAHRFLELTEPANEATAADTSILDESHATIHHSYSSDIPVPHTPSADSRPGRGENGHSADNSNGKSTPLVQKLQGLSLADSPASDASRRPTSAFLTTFSQNEWWISKANLATSQWPSEEVGSNLRDEVEAFAAALEAKTIENKDLLRLARISQISPLIDDMETPAPDALWEGANLYGRIVDQLCRLLGEAEDEECSFNCLVALLNLVTQQSQLLNGRELSILETLFQVSRTRNKNIRTGAECVALGVVSATEPLYAASCLRMCIEDMQEPAEESGRNEDYETYAWTYTMGLKALGSLFSLLPSEVLEEELVRFSGIIKKALNASQASLRQAAATLLVKAHQVIQDDNKLFRLVDGLSKAQINLCTYLFARNSSTS